MSVITKTQKATITVANAAFLYEMKDSNFRLWALLDNMRGFDLTDDSFENTVDFVAVLAELRDSLALQFSLEETYGFIESVPSSSVFGLVDAGKAKQQHRELYLQIQEVCEQAEEAQYRGTIGRDLGDFFQLFEQFDANFRAHEDFEAELIRIGLGGKHRDL